MQRSIKFRAWDTRKRKTFKMNYGIGLFSHNVSDEYGDEWFDLEDGAEWDNPEDRYIVWMQYTGLKDKNGKEIYESDILKDTLRGDLSVCEWFEPEIDTAPAVSGFTFRSLEKVHGFAIYEASWLRLAEIVGNIYENPELLKENNE